MSVAQLSEDQIKALFEKALDLQNNNQLNEALAVYSDLLEMFPDAFLLHYNAGLIYFEKEEYEKSLYHYNKAKEEVPEEPNLLYNLGLCLKKNQNIKEAISIFESLLLQDPSDTEILYMLAGCYREDLHLELAAVLYEKLLAIEPDHRSATNNLAYTYHRLNQKDDALTMYRKVLALQPGHKGAEHMIATLTGANKAQSENEYIEELFDSYSDTFESSLLGTLQYQVPRLVGEQLRATRSTEEKFVHCLDLGCGTGLAAVEIKDYCAKISGLDLSSKMVQKSKEKGLYHHLSISDITGFSQQTDEKYDLFVAADVFSYIGVLEDTFEDINAMASPKAQLIFSVEHQQGEGVELGATGRYTHSPDYIEQLAHKNSMRLVTKTQAMLRMEAGEPVVGWIYTLETQ